MHLTPSLVARTLTLRALTAVLLATLALPAAATPPADLMLTTLSSALTRPVAIRNAGDGSGRLFIVEQAGVIRIYDTNAGMLLGTPFIDITALVDDTGNEQGLLGLAFHPNYSANGFFYVNYTWDPGPGLDRTRIVRYTRSGGNPNVADPASAFVLLEINQDFDNHNGGDIHFGRDGYLYIGMGDGGGSEDMLNRAQDMGELLGKMLRIDVDGTPPPMPNDLCGLVTNYGIPPGNPFAGGSGDCDEIWALGVRNPWRWSFDRANGDLFIGDVGQGPTNPREEIDHQPASSTGGENYGWSCREGNLMPNFNPCRPGPLTDPILVYDHASGNCAVTGGFRYRGNVIGGLGGTYVYGDACSGRIWFATQSGLGVWSTMEWMNTPNSVAGFGEDENGELYVANLGGSIQRFTSASSIFTDGFETGDTSVWSGVVP